MHVLDKRGLWEYMLSVCVYMCVYLSRYIFIINLSYLSLCVYTAVSMSVFGLQLHSLKAGRLS